MHPRSLLGQLTRRPHDKPCDADWESMEGDDKLRHCASCDREVYAISSMTALEAEVRLLNARDAVPCIRYARDEDGRVLHLAPYVAASTTNAAPARALVVASALGVALAPVVSEAKPRSAPSQCVVFTQPADPVVVAAARPPAPSAGAAAPPAAAPAAAPPPSAGGRGAATAPAPAPQPSPPPPRPPEPVMLGGAPPPPEQRAVYGFLNVKSKVERDITVGGIALKAPLSAYLFTPGDFVLEYRDAKGKLKKLKVKIKAEAATNLDLDAR